MRDTELGEIGQRQKSKSGRQTSGRRRKSFWHIWLCGFAAGAAAQILWGSMLPGHPVLAEEVGPVTGEMAGEMPAAGEAQVVQDFHGISGSLPLVLYNELGQKLCVRQDAVLEIEETLTLELPVKRLKDCSSGTLQLRFYREDGTCLERNLQIKWD